MIGGVAGGLAEWLDVDPTIVRLGWVVAALLTQGLAIAVYIAMIFLVPEEPWAATESSFASAAEGQSVDAARTTSSLSTAESPAAGVTSAGNAPSAPAESAASAPPPTAPLPEWQPGATDWRDARRRERDAQRAARRQARIERGDRGPGSGVVLLGVLLILAGIYFLVREYVPDIQWNLVWPVALVALGILLVVRSLGIGGRGSAPPSTPA
jgi:phage shock protein C